MQIVGLVKFFHQGNNENVRLDISTEGPYTDAVIPIHGSI